VQPEFGEEDHYPYTYAPHDTLIQHALRPDLSPADRRAAVDAATLTIVLATHDAPSRAATIGYSLLRAVRDTGNTCDVQTSIAYLVAIGTTPDLDHVRVEVAAAEQLCPIWNSSSRATATTGRSTAPMLRARPTRRIRRAAATRAATRAPRCASSGTSFTYVSASIGRPPEALPGSAARSLIWRAAARSE
jgi:hypothetical protein